MIKKLSFLLCFMYSCHLAPVPSSAQMTTVSATVADQDGTSWAYGSVTVQFVPNPANPNPANYRINGSPLSDAVTNQGPVSLGAGGSFSLSVYDNTLVTPIGSQWKYTICPNASVQCFNFTASAAGATQNLTSTVSASIIVPRFKAIAGSYGYNDTEASLLLQPGSTYWNTTLGQQRFWNAVTSTWVTGAGTAGGTVNNFAAPSASWPPWLVPTVTNPTSSPSLSVTASAIPASAIVGNGCITLGSTAACLNQTISSVSGLTVDGATPTNLASVDTTTSITSQLANKVDESTSSQQTIASALATGMFYIAPYYTANPANPVVFVPGTGASTDLLVKNTVGGTTLQVNDSGDILNDNGTVIPSGVQGSQGPSTGYVLLVSAAPTGTGAPCLQSGCALINPTATFSPALSPTDYSPSLATTAWVTAFLNSISAGVTNINSFSGSFSIPSLHCTAGSPVTCTFSSTGIANVLLSIPAGLSAAANTCYGWNGSSWVVRAGTNYGTFSMPGVVITPSQSNVGWGWQGSPANTNGWGKVGGLTLNLFAVSANTVGWEVCNQTSSGPIASGTPNMIISAQ